jgi:hypothetical protein
MLNIIKITVFSLYIFPAIVMSISFILDFITFNKIRRSSEAGKNLETRILWSKMASISSFVFYLVNFIENYSIMSLILTCLSFVLLVLYFILFRKKKD